MRKFKEFACFFILIFLLISSICLAAGPSYTIDLAAIDPGSGDLKRIFGSDGRGNLGVPVAGGFDCNGDGFNDYAVAYMTASPFDRTNAGEVFLIFGDGKTKGEFDTINNATGSLRIIGDVEGSASGLLNGEATGSEIWMADVTGDGVGDLLICRQNFTPSENRSGAGSLEIIIGGPELTSFTATLQHFDFRNPPAELKLFRIIGDRANDRLGIWVRTGDVTGDGIADIVLGADQADPSGDRSGEIFVIRGGDHLSTSTIADMSNFGNTVLAGHVARISPPPSSARFHLGATCQIADLDNNGRTEVLAAATLNRAGASINPPEATERTSFGSGGAPDGILYILWDDNFTTGPWPVGYSFSIDAAPGSTTALQGEISNISFGEEILGGLDFNGDNLADLFVGDIIGDGTPAMDRSRSGVGYVFYHAALLRNIHQRISEPLPAGVSVTEIYGPNSGALGADTAALGDFDNDGFGDLAFGSPHANPQGRSQAGTVHFIMGQDSEWPAVIDLMPGALPDINEVRIIELQGAKANDVLCYSAAAGDIDGDGLTDLIVNEMLGDGPTAINAGNLLVVPGRLTDLPKLPGISELVEKILGQLFLENIEAENVNQDSPPTVDVSDLQQLLSRE